MVIELLRDQRRARHEAERLVEIFEREFFDDGVATFDFAPTVKLGERALARAAGQFVCHGDDLCSDCATNAASAATRKHSPNSYLSLKGRRVGPPTQSDAAGGYDVLVAQYRQDRRNGGPRPRHFPVVFGLDLRRELGRGRTAGRLARPRLSGALVRVRGSA